MNLFQKSFFFLFMILSNGFAMPSVQSEEGPYFEMAGGGVKYYTTKEDLSTTELYSDIQYGDIDGDGVIDLLFSKGYRASRGQSNNWLKIYRGSQRGFFSLWEQKSLVGTRFYSFCLGDFIKDNKQDCFLAEISLEPSPSNFTILDYQQNELFIIPLSIPSFSSYSAVLYPGDFDGDSNADILSPGGTILFGDGKGNFETHTISLNNEVSSNIITADFNQDGIGDIVYITTNKRLKILWGNKNRSTSLSDSQYIDNSLQTYASITTIDLNKDAMADVYIHSVSGAGFWVNHTNKQFSFTPISLSENFNPEHSQAGQINKDGFCDLVSWNQDQIHIFFGDGQGNFHLYESITIPYIQQIYNVDIVDINIDGRNDILVYPVDHASVSLINRENPPALKPVFTPTPSIPFIAPTPTPMVPDKQDILLHPGDSLAAAVQDRKSNKPIFMASGEYYKEGFEPKQYAAIELDLSGINFAEKPIISNNFYFSGCSLVFKNLIFNPHPSFWNSLSFGNCDLFMESCRIKGTERYVDSERSYYFTGEPSVIIENCLLKHIVLAHCEIEPGVLNQNILIRSCTDTIVDLLQSPMLGQERAANIRIEDSKNITICLPVDYPYGLSQINAIRSIVTVIGGTLTGVNGVPDVIGQDGEEGIKATDNSIIHINNTAVYGGKGGDGLTPGKDANPIYTDETSRVIIDAKVEPWELY